MHLQTLVPLQSPLVPSLDTNDHIYKLKVILTITLRSPFKWLNAAQKLFLLTWLLVSFQHAPIFQTQYPTTLRSPMPRFGCTLRWWGLRFCWPERYKSWINMIILFNLNILICIFEFIIFLLFDFKHKFCDLTYTFLEPFPILVLAPMYLICRRTSERINCKILSYHHKIMQSFQHRCLFNG